MKINFINCLLFLQVAIISHSSTFAAPAPPRECRNEVVIPELKYGNFETAGWCTQGQLKLMEVQLSKEIDEAKMKLMHFADEGARAGRQSTRELHMLYRLEQQVLLLEYSLALANLKSLLLR